MNIPRSVQDLIQRVIDNVDQFYVLTTAASTTTIVDGRKTVTAAGTAERLVATSTVVKWVDIQALRNTQYIAVGASTVVVAAGSDRGTVLGPETSVRYEGVDLYDIWIDVEVNGEGVCFTYGT